MKKYTVNTPIQFSGTAFGIGETIELDNKQAAQLLELEAISEGEAQPEADVAIDEASTPAKKAK